MPERNPPDLFDFRTEKAFFNGGRPVLRRELQEAIKQVISEIREFAKFNFLAKSIGFDEQVVMRACTLLKVDRRKNLAALDVIRMEVERTIIRTSAPN